MLDDDILTQIALLKAEYDRLYPYSGTNKWFGPGPFSIDSCLKHKAFFSAGADYRERLFMAANRVGKSVAGAFEMACHLTGVYPDWWVGARFSTSIKAYACGITGVTTRDTVQKELLGPLGEIGTGMIPADCILSTSAKPGIPNAIETVLVRHVSGGVSECNFRSYDQGVRGFQGTARHFIWLDEECPDEIYGECLIRTMTTKGHIIVTFTPQNGLTPFILSYHKSADLLLGAVGITAESGQLTATDTNSKKYRCVIQAGWDDAPWLDDDEKKRMLEKTEPHLRDARSKGIPSIGDGNIYPLHWDTVSCEPFDIPHHWKRLYAMDVGWNYTACLFGAIDPETETTYFYTEYKQEKRRPEEHALRIKEMSKGWIPGVIDPASRGRSQIDGTQLISIYRSHGLRLQVADNAVESGIAQVWDRLYAGKIKFFKTLHKTREEYLLYRRENERIVKENDHLMDCVRYFISKLNLAKTKNSSMPLGMAYDQGDTSGRDYLRRN